ncbi:hypothetical protein RFI_25209 [Reticulomyxa filosa]|uniref:Glutamine amidotransferase domain-containing protein n=1 Tax=Reticulomyxa filosa TaxID=46433 RepID=X6ME35_RETFI|nr:hypothetical protein RFI_25209 [Reticulomyxa filosa]|eukprot:ETO12169.1 hypothetical protein RFI_25209 [Reticulomyxa filosa]
MIKLLGIAVSGKSGRAKSGWEVGLRTLTFSADAEKKLPAIAEALSQKSGNKDKTDTNTIELNVHEFHQDQIYELPSNATILASSKKCPVEMFESEGVVLGIQGHPEFSTEYHQALIRNSLNSEFKKVFQAGLQELTINKHDNNVFQSFMRKWLKKD